jgi:putative membrane protein
MGGRVAYQLLLIAAFLAVWVWAAINPTYRDGWLLENYLVFIFVPLILGLSYFFRLSNVSYTLITIFMILHVIGSHYTYAEVPFGYMLQDWFGSSRNMYDRLVHFCFGFLLAYPIRELFMRVAHTRGIWSYYLPVDLTFAFSAVYEIIEWLAAATVDPTAGLAFLGSQGDVWDAQKDMLVAGLGALISMTIVMIINFFLKKDFAKDFIEGFKIRKRPLGEVKLLQMIRKK